MADFDVAIVGAGVAGCSAAYLLAKAGLNVLLVERGNFAGSKNVTGGRLYSHSLEKIMPGFAAEAPVERRVVKEKVSFLTDDSMSTLDFQSQRLARVGSDSYVVLRSKFDRWLAEKAEAAGATLVTGIRVDELLHRESKIVGIKAGEDEIEADVVILADGVNSLLAQQAKFKKELTPQEVAVGVKEIIELPAQTIEDRFNVNPSEGVSWLFVGCTEGGIGGGFLYTNKDSISLGIVLTLSEVEKIKTSIPELLEKLKAHPAIQPLIKGGKLAEYSAHLVPEAGQHMIPRLYGDNMIVVGDAAGLAINIGYMVRGMDLAIASAEYAAQTIIEAKERGDFSASTLASYKTKLDTSFVGKDMDLYRKFPHFLEKTPRMFDTYPEMAAEMMTSLFMLDGQPAQPLRKKMMKYINEVGYLNLVKDGIRGIGAL